MTGIYTFSFGRFTRILTVEKEQSHRFRVSITNHGAAPLIFSLSEKETKDWQEWMDWCKVDEVKTLQ